MQFRITKIMTPIDGSKNSLAALQAAVTLAKDYFAELIIVNVLAMRSISVSLSVVSNIPSARAIYDEEERSAQRMLDDAVAFANRNGAKAKGELLVKQTSVVEAILTKAADEKVDLVVIGTRGLGGFKRLIIGSVSTGVVTHAHCPVLVVR